MAVFPNTKPTFILTMETIILHPGKVLSRNDKDIHFITSSMLINLYGIDQRKFRVLVSKDWNIKGIHLCPLYRGNYKEEAERQGIL